MAPVAASASAASSRSEAMPKSATFARPFAYDVEDRIERFATWKKKLFVRDDILGGEPVFSKSRLAVRQIGEMRRRGASVKEIVEDYPYIDERDVEFAKQYVTAYPRLGRPRVRDASVR